ncbi:amino acid permease [Streptosporangium carneum]|uniref:Gamma-aminobutyrate permease n=1 Tax=Streptosporangium carneum TaxID=47481 RepID=A0A9W6MFH4_9ACTN|nr:amino acid permease [Streptosporangium carneum]GLK12266.1 gamma-aminobutyrate permease [Streptosporangium carneum]
MAQGETALRRGLRRRHMTMIGIGGVIGAGLFVSSGAVISTAGPAAVVAYAVGGVIVILVMRMLGEMSAAYPTTGSFSRYAELALGRWAGFLVGWSYWYFTVSAIAFESVAGARLVSGLVPGLPVWLGAPALLLALTAANLVSVKVFGETEFWLSSAKVAVVVGFLAVGALYLVGLWPDGGAGLSALTAHGGFAPNGWTAVLSALVTVIFSYFGAELVTIAAAESAEPAREVARATVRVVWRVLIFYVGSVFLIVAVVPWNKVPANGEDSPFAAAIGAFGVPGASGLMTVVVLVAVLSILNAGIYGSSRMLMSLAERGDAPAPLARVRPSGVPAPSILASIGLAFVVVAVAGLLGPDEIFGFLLNTSGLLTLVIYLFIAVSQLRLRALADPATLPVRMWGHPWLSWAVIVLLVAALLAVATSPGVGPIVLGVLVILAVTRLAYTVRARLGRTAPPIVDPMEVS